MSNKHELVDSYTLDEVSVVTGIVTPAGEEYMAIAKINIPTEKSVGMILQINNHYSEIPELLTQTSNIPFLESLEFFLFGEFQLLRNLNFMPNSNVEGVDLGKYFERPMSMFAYVDKDSRIFLECVFELSNPYLPRASHSIQKYFDLNSNRGAFDEENLFRDPTGIHSLVSGHMAFLVNPTQDVQAIALIDNFEVEHYHDLPFVHQAIFRFLSMNGVKVLNCEAGVIQI